MTSIIAACDVFQSGANIALKWRQLLFLKTLRFIRCGAEVNFSKE